MYGCSGFAEHLLGRAHLDDRAAAEDHRLVADVVAEREVVRDEQDAEPARLQVAEQVEHVDARRGVEHADDLVGDEQLDVEEQRARDEHALELAAAQLVRVLAEDVRRVEAHGLQRLLELARATRTSSVPGSRRLRSIVKTRSALKIGLYELNGSWKTPWTSA